jgi:hypothetical protein
MADELSATHAVSPAGAQLGTRKLPIDNSPMRQSNPWDTNHRPVELKQVDADCLVLEPRKLAAFWHIPLILGGAVGPVAGLVYLLLEGLQGNASLISMLILLTGFLLILALLLSGILAPRSFHRWIRFDRRTGLMTISRQLFGFRQALQVIRSRPLKDIVCVQLLHAGRQSENAELGEPGTPRSVVCRSYHSCQLNLAVDDRDEPRPNLSSHADAKWMREAGQRLAGFLRVPLVDQIPQGHSGQAVLTGWSCDRRAEPLSGLIILKFGERRIDISSMPMHRPTGRSCGPN